jgi:hypothetical protein
MEALRYPSKNYKKKVAASAAAFLLISACSNPFKRKPDLEPYPSEATGAQSTPLGPHLAEASTAPNSLAITKEGDLYCQPDEAVITPENMRVFYNQHSDPSDGTDVYEAYMVGSQGDVGVAIKHTDSTSGDQIINNLYPYPEESAKILIKEQGGEASFSLTLRAPLGEMILHSSLCGPNQ